MGALRILLSENTFAGHWETVVDCMENIGKCEQWLILPRNCLRTQLWFHKNIQSSIQKVPMGSTIQRQLLISGVLHGSKCVPTSRSGSRCHLLLSVLMSLCPSPAPQLLLSGFWSPGCMPMPTIIFTASVHAGALLGTNSRPILLTANFMNCGFPVKTSGNFDHSSTVSEGWSGYRERANGGLDKHQHRWEAGGQAGNINI